MSEFRIHRDVNELLSLLRIHGGGGAEVYIDLLQKNRTPYVTTTVSAHSAKVKIAEFSRTPEDFLKKYDELKSKNTRNLDPLVYLLSKLTEDKEVSFLPHLHHHTCFGDIGNTPQCLHRVLKEPGVQVKPLLHIIPCFY